eukprot:CCRYP_004042-RA/>CCRYP_004042-RA protein AED:0.84 eAED:0.75 QI:0/0/0/0.5/1/1/2/0/112
MKEGCEWRKAKEVLMKEWKDAMKQHFVGSLDDKSLLCKVDFEKVSVMRMWLWSAKVSLLHIAKAPMFEGDHSDMAFRTTNPSTNVRSHSDELAQCQGDMMLSLFDLPTLITK